NEKNPEGIAPWPLWSDLTEWLPVIGEMLTPGFFFSILFFLILSGFFYWSCFCYIRGSDFLIETEAELRKVSWPNRDELIGSSTVVVITVIVLSTYLGLVDMVLGKVFSYLL
ncbi:MAG: preprotein translocase subunit SecE, partial [Planctomycetota bacterium]